MRLIWSVLFCLCVSAFGFPEPQGFGNFKEYNGYWKNPRSFWQSRKFYTSSTTNPSVYPIHYVGEPIFAKTRLEGVFQVPARNSMTKEERNQFLPVMKALSKVMETRTPEPSDVNTLLIRTRDLMKDIPEGYKERLPAFLNKFNDIKLEFLDEGDIVVYKNGVPHVVTDLGSFPMSNVNLMTDEERERFLPVTKNVIRVLEKSYIDQNEINELITQGENLQELLPEKWNDMIIQTLNKNFEYDFDQDGNIISRRI